MNIGRSLFMAMILSSVALFAQDPCSKIWTSFKEARMAAKYDQPIRLYCVDDACTKLCYIYKDRVFIFSDGKITAPTYAKVFSTKSINRISFTSSKTNAVGSFLLWSDDEIVLSLGS
jgi:hypothetical protein